jgi:hypothetical protein
VLGASLPAAADVLYYDMTCISAPSICSAIAVQSATWTIVADAIPELPGPRFPVQAFINGSGSPVGATVSFPSLNPGPGGLLLSLPPSFGGAGPQMYQGLAYSPLLLAGTFTISGSAFGTRSKVSWAVEVDDTPGFQSPIPPAPVPVPAAFGLMLAGLGLLGLLRAAHRPDGPGTSAPA